MQNQILRKSDSQIIRTESGWTWYLSKLGKCRSNVGKLHEIYWNWSTQFGTFPKKLVCLASRPSKTFKWDMPNCSNIRQNKQQDSWVISWARGLEIYKTVCWFFRTSLNITLFWVSCLILVSKPCTWSFNSCDAHQFYKADEVRWDHMDRIPLYPYWQHQ